MRSVKDGPPVPERQVGKCASDKGKGSDDGYGEKGMGDGTVTKVDFDSFGNGVKDATDVGIGRVYVGKVTNNDCSDDKNEGVFTLQRGPPEKWDKGSESVSGRRNEVDQLGANPTVEITSTSVSREPSLAILYSGISSGSSRC